MKTKTLFVCQNCGTQSPRWAGKCSGCDRWNSLVEEAIVPSTDKRNRTALKEKPVLLMDIMAEEEKRYTTTIKEFDGVMGGGIVPGAVTLIGGDPGIGKSTMSLQVGCALSEKGCKDPLDPL